MLFTTRKIFIFVATSTFITIYLAIKLLSNNEPEKSHFVPKNLEKRKVFELGEYEFDGGQELDFFAHLRKPKQVKNITKHAFQPVNVSRAGFPGKIVDNRTREQIMRYEIT